MTRRMLVVGFTAAAIAAAPAVGAAGGTKTTTTPRIDILGGASFVTNRYIQDKLRFGKDVYSLKSGVTIQIKSKTPDEPHTVSVVSRSDIPKTVNGFGACFERGICGKLSKAHGVPEGGGPPTMPLVNVGKPGFDVKGDSIVVAPGKGGSVKLSASAGKTLHFFCAIHPWMQAKITVR